jgi:CheY-like chemotaxis protein
MVETILLVYGQNPVLDSLAANGLSSQGFQVMTARDGPTGLDLVIRHNPDLVLIEQSLEQITGLEVLSILNQTACISPVIFLTDPGMEQTIIDAFRLGAKDCLLKPVSAGRVRQAIDEALLDRRKSLEAAEMQRNQIATDMVQAVVITLSHYLNNYLTTLKGGLALIDESIRQEPSNPEVQRITRETQASVLNIQAVINALVRSDRFRLTSYSPSTMILAIETAIREEITRLSIQPQE